MLSANVVKPMAKNLDDVRNVWSKIFRCILVKWRIFWSFEANYQKIYQPCGGGGAYGWSIDSNVLIMIDLDEDLDSADFQDLSSTETALLFL